MPSRHANWLDNTLSAIDVATRAVTPIALDGRPWAVAMSPDGALLYAGLGSNKIAVIGTANDAIERSIDTSPDLPESVVVSADGTTLYVAPTASGGTASLGPGSLEALSATTGAVVHAPIPVGSTPIISGSTPDGLLAVTDFGADNLVTIDATNAVVHTLALDGRPVGVGGFNKAGTLAYVCDFGHASLGVAESLQALSDFSMGNVSAFVGNGPGHVTAFDPTTGKAIGKPITAGRGPISIVAVAP